MQNVYFVSYELNGERVETKHYLREKEAMNAAKALMIKQSKAMKVGEYLSAIRTGKYHSGYTNKKYRAAVARYIRKFFSDPSAQYVRNYYVCDDDPNEYVSEKYADADSFDDFTCYCEAGCTVLEFHFGDKLMIDSNFITMPDVDGAYFYIKDTNTEFKVNIEFDQVEWFCEDSSSTASNILLVYYTLDCAPQKLEDIQKEIREATSTVISTKTIGQQIVVLKQLGLPIAYTYRGGNEFDPIDPGYHIKSHSLKSIPDMDAKGIGTSAYLMLVLITLVRTERAMSASEIIEYISEHFKVNMSKSTVLRHLNFLVEIAFAEKSKGYYACLEEEVKKWLSI